MTDKQKIRAEEEELERFAYSLPHSADGFWPKDIDCYSQEARTKYGVHHYWSYEQVMNIARHFAEWQREQLMKDAVDGRVDRMIKRSWVNIDQGDLEVCLREFDKGEKVKVIIIKED